MRKAVGYGLLTISFLTLIVWAISQFIQPILPSAINDAGILLFAALLSVAGFIAAFKDTIELFSMFTQAKGNESGQEKPSRTVIQGGASISKAEHVIIQSVLEQSAGKPTRTTQAAASGVSHNLPQPDYGEFVGREKELAQVASILRPYPHSQYPVVTIDGIGGIGKSSLALEMAHRFLHSHGQLPSSEQFGAIVWISAKRVVLTSEGIFPRNQALSTLGDIFSTIVSVLRPDAKFESYTQQRQYDFVASLLVNQRTLLIVDNLETVDDESVLSFLRELPAPTKAIVTTRHRIDVAYPVRLMGMPWVDARELIRQECKKKKVSVSETQEKLLYRRTGGVPLAIVWSIGQLGFGHSIESVLNRLGNAEGDITRFCFEESVKLIRGTNAHKLLMVSSALDSTAEREALGQIAGLSVLDRDEGLVQLEKLSLVNKEGNQFSMLPLTKAYAYHELKTHPEFEQQLRFELLYKFGDLSFERIAPETEFWWKSSATEGLIVPIGLVGIDQIQELRLDNRIQTHALIAGRSGSGKSNLLSVIITNLALHYSPAELNLYLLDFKGVEFKDYAGNEDRGPLPHARVVATSTDRDYGLSVLKSLEKELSKRSQLFRRLGVNSYPDYRAKTAEPLPRLLVIIEEFYVLLSEGDRLAHQADNILATLVRQGRAFGIHFLLSSQTFAGSLSYSTFSLFSVRIALQMDNANSRLFLAETNSAAELLSRPGQAIYNSSYGLPEANSFFQAARLSPDTQESLLNQLLHFASNNETQLLDSFQPVIFEGDAPAFASRNIDLRNLLDAPSWPHPPDSIRVWLGEPFAVEATIYASIRRRHYNNILIVAQDESVALGVLTATTLSIAAQCPPDKAEFIFVRSGAFGPKEWPFESGELPHQIRVANKHDVGLIFEELATLVDRRLSSDQISLAKETSLFVFILGLHLHPNLRMQINDQPTETAETLEYLLETGPSVGVHLVVWCNHHTSFVKSGARSAMDTFAVRVVTQVSPEASFQLLDSHAATNLRHGQGYLYTGDLRLAKFKPYLPLSQEPDWLAWAKTRLLDRTNISNHPS